MKPIRYVYAHTRVEREPGKYALSHHGRPDTIDPPSKYVSDGPGSFRNDVQHVDWEPMCCTATETWPFIIWRGKEVSATDEGEQ